MIPTEPLKYYMSLAEKSSAAGRRTLVQLAWDDGSADLGITVQLAMYNPGRDRTAVRGGKPEASEFLNIFRNAPIDDGQISIS